MKKYLFITIFAFITVGFATAKNEGVQLGFGLISPIIKTNLDADYMSDTLDTVGFGGIIQCYVFNTRTNFTFNVKVGAAYGQSTVDGFNDAFKGATLHFLLGLGYRFHIKRLSIIPCVEFGYHLAFLNSFLRINEYKADADILALGVELGGDLYISYLCTREMGVFASVGITFNLGGIGNETVTISEDKDTEEFSVKAGTVNVFPTFGIFLRY